MNIKKCQKERLQISYMTIYSIAVFKINVFFVLLKGEPQNNSTSENLESFGFKILFSMFRMLVMRINLSSEKREIFLSEKIKNEDTRTISKASF